MKDLTKKLNMSEEDIKLKYITPSLEKANWNIKKQINMEYSITNGPVTVKNKKALIGTPKRADYVLSYEKYGNIAVIEAKSNQYDINSGIQQAVEYAEMLQVPFAYSSNGDGFLERDLWKGTSREFSLEEFPSPDELFERVIAHKNFNDNQLKLIGQPLHYNPGDFSPRYYQINAIAQTIEAIAKGKQRVLLVMATGTGKTYTAFQIIYKLLKSGTKKKILFLADRNILIDQTMTQDFKPFAKKMTKIKDKKPDSSYEIYLSLYHQLAGDENNEPFRQFKPDFFDLIIIDECHRGSAKEKSNWRKILEYFSSATHIGMTATPKETKEVSNIDYFGEPVYTYSLKQGINDGFLAPFKVIRVGIDKDLMGWTPEYGELDDNGKILEQKTYMSKDFDKNLILSERTKLVARKITNFLKENERMDKTIVFCVDIEHARRMTEELVNLNSDMMAENSKYVMQITGDEEIGKRNLDNFIDPDSPYPVIVTTSKLMTTGIDAKTCKLIVLDSNIKSITEFKQIVGRGTRLKPDYGKYYFTIMDFRGVTKLFSDPEFDGEPVSIIEEPLDNNFSKKIKKQKNERKEKLVVSNVKVKVTEEFQQFYNKNGQLITNKIKDFTKKNILNKYATLNKFINFWTSSEKTNVIIEELENLNISIEVLRKEFGKAEIDDFDLLCHIAYNKKPLTRKERIQQIKEKGYLNNFSDIAKKVVSAILDKYMDGNIENFEDLDILRIDPFTHIGSPNKIVYAFGGRKEYIQFIKELKKQIYSV